MIIFYTEKESFTYLFTGTTCPRTFSDTSKQCSVCGLAAHVWVHPDEGPDAQVWLVPRCHWCNQADGVKGRKVTGKWVTLVDDSFAVTIDEFNHKCDFCDEKFFTKRGVGQHEKRSTQKNPKKNFKNLLLQCQPHLLLVDPKPIRSNLRIRVLFAPYVGTHLLVTMD